MTRPGHGARPVGPSDGVGGHLRRWRTRRELSQLAVAVECGVSTRHLSFVETGRARPSQALVLHLARFLGATNRELNEGLLVAGHAPLHVGDLGVERTALDETLGEMLERHPCPAFVFTAGWVMERLNRSGQWLCSVLMPGLWSAIDAGSVGLDMIAALTHHDGLLSRVRDAPRVGTALLRQLRVEQLTNPRLKDRVDTFEWSLSQRFPTHPIGDAPDFTEPSLHLQFGTTHGPLSFFTLQSVVGIPQHITVATPRVELWFPADVHTRHLLDRHVVRLDEDHRPTARVTRP